MNQDEILKQFYQEYCDWLMAGAPKHPSFKKHHGLCSALFLWLEPGFKERVLTRLREHLSNSGLSTLFPFNSSGRNYFQESRNNACHLNPKRIAWVKQQLEK